MTGAIIINVSKCSTYFLFELICRYFFPGNYLKKKKKSNFNQMSYSRIVFNCFIAKGSKNVCNILCNRNRTIIIINKII